MVGFIAKGKRDLWNDDFYRLDCVYAAAICNICLTKSDQGPQLDQNVGFDMDECQGRKWLDPILDLILISSSEEWLMLWRKGLHTPLKTVASNVLTAYPCYFCRQPAATFDDKGKQFPDYITLAIKAVVLYEGLFVFKHKLCIFSSKY